jgi:hypothetical protein
MIKINTHKIKYQHKNKYLFETIIPRKQTKISNTIYFSTNPILNDKIKKKLKTIVYIYIYILFVGKLIKHVNQISRTSTPNM